MSIMPPVLGLGCLPLEWVDCLLDQKRNFHENEQGVMMSMGPWPKEEQAKEEKWQQTGSERHSSRTVLSSPIESSKILSSHPWDRGRAVLAKAHEESVP